MRITINTRGIGMKINIDQTRIFCIIWTIFALHATVYTQDKNEIPLYLKPGIPVDEKVEDLISRMSLEDKVGQMNVTRPRMVKLDHENEFDGCVHFIKGTLLPDIGPGGGLKSINLEAKGEIDFINKLQKIAI